MEILSHYTLILPSKKNLGTPDFHTNTFPTKMKPSKCPTKEKGGEEKQKKGGGVKAKGKSQGGSVTLHSN